MKPMSSDPAAPIDDWRAVARRGVMAVRFSVQRFAGERWLAAQIATPPDGLVRRAAYGAIAIDKLIAQDASPDAIVRRALAKALETGPAPLQQAAYQARLLERLWSAIEGAPAERLAALASAREG